MTKRATVTQADLTRLARVAKAEGCAIEVTLGAMKIRVIPDKATEPCDLRVENGEPVL